MKRGCKTRNRTMYCLCGPRLGESEFGGLLGFQDFEDIESGETVFCNERIFKTRRKAERFLSWMDRVAEDGEIMRYRVVRRTPSGWREWRGSFVWRGWNGRGERMVSTLKEDEEPETVRIPFAITPSTD